MKKIMTFLLLVLSLTAAETKISNAQWVQQSAIPTGRALRSAYFVTPSHGFVVGINHFLMETTDSGVTWSVLMIDSFGTDPFNRITIDGDVGFIVGNSLSLQQDILRTIDAGQTWTPVTNFPIGGSWHLIDFVSPDKAYFGSNGACVFTPDSGNTFVVRSGYPNCPVMYGMDFLNEQVGLIAGSLSAADGIFKTIDSGITWQQKHSVSTNDVLWWTDSIALGISGTFIYRSADAGESWNLFSSGITSGLLELERIDNLSLAGVSGKGDIWRSADEGQTWTQVFDGPGDLPQSWSLHFTDSQHGWLVGEWGFIYTSNDGGLTWVQVSNGAGPQITDLAFLNDNFGLGVGENGYIFRTTNGGNWWDMQKLEVTGQIFGRTESLHGISIVDSSFAVAAGPGGTVFKTTNGGITWQSIGYPNLPDPFWIEDVKFIDHNTGWVVGLDQDLGHDKTVYKTTDGGATWVLAMNQGGYMWAVEFTDLLHGWIITTGGANFYTTDGGISWQPGNLPPYLFPLTISDIEFVNQNVGWIVGWDGFASHTTDGGVTWTNQNIGTTTDHLFSVKVISPTEAWASGREADGLMQGVLYHTTDGGNTWTREITSPNPYWGYALAVTPSYMWIAGYEGRIYRRGGIITGIETEENVSSQTLLNYPNPFHLETTIRYNVSNRELISLKVYNTIGKEVATLIDGNQSTGVHEVIWNASGFSPGVYYYKFSEGKIQVTGKLILQ